MFPAAYILLQNKERETYIKAFTSVKEILVSNNCTLNVQETLTDFELALIQAISITFGNAKIYGCWFHFNQALIRYLFEKCNKRTLYNENYEFEFWIRRFRKYESAWNHFDNSGPRTNNHLEGYHSKLPSLPSARDV
ncbi:hypothetical protein BpHYR1_050096 [Brachionus plicatilis]|uniref:MULE transposase domain-containing protein n=1 Tax=Brachionus plicatilis TaxID=10195 RepID=A0A3M7PKE6_BRAPC|nr:hypothetical protein BpHYR1_050096 [Brachionus plicatilis]